MENIKVREETAADVSDSLRIMYVSETPIDDNYPNGVLTTTKRILEYLGEQGHEVKIVCPRTDNVPDTYAGHGIKTVRSAVVQDFPVGIGGQNKIAKLEKKFRPDVAIFASPFGPMSETAINVAKTRGVPSVSMFMTDIAQYAYDQGNATIERYMGMKKPGSASEYAPVVRTARQLAVMALRLIGLGHNAKKIASRRHAALHNQTDITLVPSTATRDVVSSYGIDQDSLRILSRGVDSVMYHPDLKNTQRVQQLSHYLSGGRDVPIGLYVGRMAPEKDLETLAVLKPLLSDMSLVMVGDGPSLPAIKELLGDEVLFVGAKHGSELADYYAAADIFIHPGTKETFGQTIQEAKAAGIPPVAPAIGGPVDTIIHGETGYLFNPHKPHELREYVEQMIRSPDLRIRIGQQARRSIELISWSQKGQELVQHAQDAIAMHKKPRASVRQNQLT